MRGSKAVVCTKVENDRPVGSGEGLGWVHPLNGRPRLEVVDDDWVDHVLAQHEGRARFDVFVYRDADGKAIRSKVRRSDGKKWWKDRKVKVTVPYRLPQLLEGVRVGQAVWIVDGERDVDALRSKGVVSPCAPNNMASWKDEHSKHLAGPVERGDRAGPR